MNGLFIHISMCRDVFRKDKLFRKQHIIQEDEFFKDIYQDDSVVIFIVQIKLNILLAFQYSFIIVHLLSLSFVNYTYFILGIHTKIAIFLYYSTLCCEILIKC